MQATAQTAAPVLNLAKLADSAGLRAYSWDGSYQGSLSTAAEHQTDGRTHYFDAGTRKYFGCRVLEMTTAGDRTVLVALESVTPPNAPKAYRVVAFDMAGTVVYRTGDKGGERAGIAPALKHEPGQFGHATKARALAEYSAVLRALTPDVCRGVLVTALRAKQATAQRDAERFAAALAVI